MKALFIGLLSLVSITARAADALVLINPERAGPIVDERNYIHGEWVLWPPAATAEGQNRLLSLLTGVDWDRDSDELIFSRQGETWISQEFASLNSRGYFTARSELVTGKTKLLLPRSGISSARALLLALEGPNVTANAPGDFWVAEAESWDDVAAIVKRAGGRVLVVEYPPPARQRWSQAWLRGANWPKQLPLWKPYGIPGLIPAAQVGALLLHLERFRWVDNDASNWGGANRWLAFVQYVSPLLLSVVCFLGAFFVGSTIYLISLDEKARFGVAAMKATSLIPAAILAAGSFTRSGGQAAFSFTLPLVFLILLVAADILGAIIRVRSERAHPMLAFALIGLIATAPSPPLWGAYSNVLGQNVLPVSPEGVAALFVYLTGASVLARGTSLVWLARSFGLFLFAWGVFNDPWWVAGVWPFAFLPLLALIVGEGYFRIWMLPFLALIPLADGAVVLHGFVWAPGNLLPSYDKRDSLNLARYIEFACSPGFFGSVLVGGLMAAFVDRYFFSRVRHALVVEPRPKALFQAAMASAALGLLQPLLLYVALWSFLAGVLVLLTDTARTT